MDKGTDPRNLELSELLPCERVRQERKIIAAKKALDDAERAAHKAAQSVKDYQAAFLEGKVQRRESLPTGRIRLNSERRNSIAAKIATDQAARAAHRAAQDTKDKEFAEFLKNLEKDSARDVHSVEKTKLTLNEELDEKNRLAEKRRVNRQEIIRLEMSGNETMLERLSETYRTLELNSNAHTLDEWCTECECIHTADVLREDPEWEM